MTKLRLLIVTITLITAVFFTFCLNAAEISKEWKPLFNGQNLDGWDVVINSGKSVDSDHLVQVENGAIHMYKDATAGMPQPAGYIVTQKDYSNYHLRLQYCWGTKKFSPRMNSPRDAGLIYHIVGPDGVWPNCVECQIQEKDTGDVYTIHTRVMALVDPKTTNTIVNISTNSSGVIERKNSSLPTYLDLDQGGVCSLQGAISGTQDYQRIIRQPMNEHTGWNTVEIIVHGDEATYIVNGKINNKATKIEQLKDKLWTPLKSGKIGLQLEYAEVYYRNVEIKELE
jgi:Domain of Unknown Function (DUF1080)